MEVWLIKFCSYHVFEFLICLSIEHNVLGGPKCNYLVRAKQAPDIACRESPHVSQLSNPE